MGIFNKIIMKNKNNFSIDSVNKFCKSVNDNIDLLSILPEQYMTIVTNVIRTQTKCPFSKSNLFVYIFIDCMCMAIYTIEYKKYPHDITDNDKYNIVKLIISDINLINKVYDVYELSYNRFDSALNNIKDKRADMIYSCEKYSRVMFLDELRKYSENSKK